MIGGKLKLKNNKLLDKALKLKRRAEMSTEELRAHVDKEEKKRQEDKKRDQANQDYKEGKLKIFILVRFVISTSNTEIFWNAF